MRHTFRRLGRTPGFTAATVVTLALGIGANTAIFSVINGVLLKPLPFPEPDRLVGVWQSAPGVNIADLNASLADYVTYREDSRTFADVALWQGRAFTITEFEDPERVEGFVLTSRLLPMIGVNPILGRHFTEKDCETGSPDVLVISYGYWQRRFGGDRNVIGRRIMADGTKREIIGVLPKGFWFMDQAHDIVLPIRYDRSALRLAGYNFQAIARLRPGVALPQANADVARMIGVELSKFPPPKGMSIEMMRDAKLGPNVRPLIDDLLGDIGRSLWVIMATIGMVLLIACANVANLLLVRTEGRNQELAIRAALGAGRGRIAREMLVESILLAVIAGILGIGFAAGVLRIVLKLSPVQMPRFETIGVDGTAVLFTLAIALLAGIGCGAIPVTKYAGGRLAQTMRSGGRSLSAGRERNLARNGLTAVQVALALVLLIGSGLMIRTFQSLRDVQPGFRNPEALQTLRISIPRTAYKTDAELLRLHQAVAERLATVNGVSEASLVGGLPMTANRSQDPIAASDRTYRPDQIPKLRRFITAAPGTFRAFGTPLIAGREYQWADIHGTRRVIIISENFAKEYWGSAQAAIGKQIRSNPNDPWNEIVGVVGDIRHDGVDRPAPTTVYWPLRGSTSMTYLVRTSRAGTEALTNELRQAVWAVNGSMPVTEVRTMRYVYDRSMARTGFTLTLLAISGGMALVLAAVGIYAVISYNVAQKTREIGIRMALGAQQNSLKLLFVGRGLLWAGIGAAAGLAGAAALSRLMKSLLFGIEPVDPLTYAAVALALLVAVVIASYLPARRITLIDPSEALRAE
ncbi:MAG TPA: ABC transporter permease [Bryobacteraceae bacterium]|nr:ABC transporter permease [Bryobacteraceae bacterium]